MPKKLSESGGTNEYYAIILLIVTLLIVAVGLYVTQVRPDILNDLFALKLSTNIKVMKEERQ